MASGGYHQNPNKQSKSDSIRRSNWQRSVSSDRDDAQSLNSLPSDIRINNWDLADLHPMNLGGDSKRRKKSKGNTEREREQSLSVDSPPRGSDLRHHAQTSFPHTKINPSTPTSQKVSLEKLKQQMIFGDFDYLDNGDGERNNERRIHQIRSRLHNTSMNRMGPNLDLINHNNNVDTSTRDSAPDSKEIVTRLMQIRDFMKQARSMLESMERMGDKKKPEDVEKVRRLIQNLQDQEHGYKGLLQNTLQIERHDDGGRREGDESLHAKPEGKEEMDDSSVDLEVQTQNSETSDGSQDNSTRPRIEDKLGLGFEDEEDEQIQGATGGLGLLSASGVNASSNNTLDQMDGGANNGAMASGFSVQETEEGAKGGALVDGTSGTLDHQELVRILNEKQEQLQSLMNRQEELNVKRREAEKRLMEAQARDNKARAALAAVASSKELLQQFRPSHGTSDGPPRQRDGGGGGEPSQLEERGAVGEDGVLKSNIVGYPESDDEDNSNVREGNASLPTELMELRRELNFLRNEFSQVNESPNNMEPDTDLAEMGRQQLQNKLQELQNKKSSMDKLLHELQSLHAQPLLRLPRNNESSNPSPASKSQSTSNIPARPPPVARPPLPNLPPPNPALPLSLQTRMKEVASSAPNAVESAMATFTELAARGGDDQTAATMDPKSLEEVQDKLRRLKDVRSQLDQLRDLVEYYQGVKDQQPAGASGKSEEEVFPGDADMGSAAPRHETSRKGHMPASQNRSLESLMQQQQQASPQDFSQQLQERQNHPPNDTGASGGAQSSLLDLAQLLNLAGNENGDEHSDEDNASVSQSDSQWSNLGPWDDDPEIQEKVRKLKAAKEKLRHLQDLVAFVQQSPEGGSALPQSLGELAASVEGEAVSQATQTDEPNVSVSEGEVPVEDSQRPGEEDGSMENAQVELQQLRKERARLMDLQSQLKHLQNVVSHGNSDQEESADARDRREEMCDSEKRETEQAPNATVVTFASNDELYSKMRRQRILREELRSKKKELEAIMKKDRNKRQYSRNQDNQSDTVSLNTDTFGIPASVDATMATWGGSTVDNLENITEDEDGNADEDEDGYPSDGIVQVEEEEEENDTDNGTYTIEADARQRKHMRKPGHMGIGARPKTSRGRQTFPQPAYSDQTTKKVSKKTKRNAQSKQRESKIRQENYRSAEDLIHESEEEVKGKNPEWFRHMESRMNNLSSSVESLVKKLDTGGRQLSVSLSQENTSPTFAPPVQEQMLQLQNQSMMLSFSHIVQSLARQQGDMQQLQQQMQNLQLLMHDTNQDHSFQNLTGVAPPPSQLRPSVSTSALNNSSNFYPLSATVPPQIHQLPSPFPQMNLNNSMSSTLMSHAPFGQGSGLPPGHLGSLQHNAFPTGASNLGSNFSLHHQHGNAPSNSFAQGGRDFGQQFSNQHQHQSTSHAHAQQQQQQQLDPASGAGGGGGGGASQYSNLYNQQGGGQDREEMDEASGDRMNAYTLDKKEESDSWAKKYDFYTSQGLQMSTPKLENLEAERRRQPNDKGRRGPIGREDSSDLTPYAPLYGSTSGLDDEATGGDATDGITKLHLSSSYSSIQSIKDEHSRIKQEQGQPKSSNTEDESNTLFDSLRDTIYTEVASLISQNENRPHFLLELFREVRQIDSDLLRQRTLYSVQELVNSYLKSSSNSGGSHKPAWLNTPLSTQETANSDQTPSESVVTSDDDEDPHMSRLQAAGPLDLKSRPKLPKFPFEYEKNAENLSSMSTSSNLEEAPFFQDALGETVIEFESLKKRHRQQAGRSRLGEGAFLASEHLLRDMRNRPGRKGSKQKAGDSGRRQMDADMAYGDGASNSGVDQASESSMSDMPYPRIDMKVLDLQIKEVMMETIPVVKDHMDDICSSQLLAYIKRLVLSLTAQTGNQEFARFFHRQLSSILQDTLEKYEGRKMRECGEDLLVEISDVLFNELAFFRLMEDIEDPNEVERLRSTAATTYQGRRSNGLQEEDEQDEEDSSFNEDGDMDGERGGNDGRDKSPNKSSQRGFHISEAEQEQLGRERDDELANEMVQDGDDQEEDDDTEPSYKIELAPSETKPFTRIGSDEDDDDDSDEELSVEDLSETAVSRNDAKMGSSTPSSGGQQQSASNGPPPVRPETEGAWGEGDKEKLDVDKPVSPSKMAVMNGGDQAPRSPSHASPQMNGSVNGGLQHVDGEEDDQELTVDDLPERLTVGSSSSDTATATPSPASAAASAAATNSTDLRRRYEMEKMSLCGIDGVLASLEGIEELAGDGMAPMDPDSFLS